MSARFWSSTARVRIVVSTTLLLTLTLGCSQEPVVIPSRTLDRPTDLEFLCLRSSPLPSGGRKAVSAKPMSVCTAPTQAGDSRDPTSPTRTLGLFGLVTNSARGELGAVDFDRNRMVDLDPAIPGFNMLPVGVLPETVAVSPDGCKAVAANRGSCDLSLVDTSRLLAGVFPEADPVTGTGAVSTRLNILTDSGPLRSRPAEIAFVPEATSGERVCQVAGAMDPGGVTRAWRAVITFPSCGLVGLVEFPSGRLVNSVYVRPSGIEAAGTNPQCPSDCGPPGSDSGNDNASPDGGLADVLEGDGAGALVTGFRGRIDVEAMTFLPFIGGPDASGQELYVAARNAAVVVPLKVTKGGAMVSERPPLVLTEQPRGVTRLRPSVEPFAPIDSAFVGSLAGSSKFIYAVAGDSSVRVIDITSAGAGGFETECDANIDSLALAKADSALRGCIPVTAGLPRRLHARGPGIQVPPLAAGVDLLPPHPVDVTFFRATAATTAKASKAYNGAFAYVLLSNGDIIVVNVDTAPDDAAQSLFLSPALPLTRPFAHSIRNALHFEALDKGGDRPRVSTVPTSSLGTNELPFAVRADLPLETIPRIEGFPMTSDPYCSPEASTLAPITIYACFDRPQETVPQSWAVLWEGALPGTDRSTGKLAGGQSSSDPNTLGVWQDAGADYCAAGVQPGDVVRMIGCNVATDCGPADDFTCVPSVAGAQGLCARKTNAAAFAANPQCQRLLQSRRRFEVTYAGGKELGMGLKLQELPRPSTRICAENTDCVGLGIAIPFTCTEPVAGQGKRCVVPCTADASCAPGFVCEATGSPLANFCVEAPPPTAICLAETSIYRVQAGKSFLVQGSFSPSFATTVNVNGQCQALQSRNPRFANRIPLAAPRCSNIVDDPATKQTAQILKQSPMAAAGFPNPCLFEGPNGDDDLGTDPEFKTRSHVKALFEGPQARFILTNLEQPFGDGATMQFSVRGGFRADQVITSAQPQIAIPTKILTGPTMVPGNKDDDTQRPAIYPYVYIVDSGRLGNDQHGQILRLDTRRAAYDIAGSNHPFQIR